MFTILVCADVCCHKINLEIQFPSKPTLDELREIVDRTFFDDVRELQRTGRLTPQGEELLKQANRPTREIESGLLSLNRIQIYDDALLRWVDIVSPSQLHEFDQIYIFPKHRGHLGAHRDLPAPRPPLNQAASGPAASRRLPPEHSSVPRPTLRSSQVDFGPHSSVPRGDIATVESTKARTLFAEFDNANGYLTFNEFKAMFQRAQVLFNETTIEEMFRFHAASGSFMTFADFISWARAYPTAFNAIHSRLQERARESTFERDLNSSIDAIHALQARRDELTREMDVVRQQLLNEESRCRSVEDELESMRGRRQRHEEEEQVLLEKEVRVQYQKEMLMREEDELANVRRSFQEKSSTAQKPLARRSGYAYN